MTPDGGPAGVMTTARHKRNPGQHGRPQPVSAAAQHAAREGWAWPGGESERSIVPSKPGNAGGGKGPWFKRCVERGDRGRLAMSLQPPNQLVKLQTALHAKAKAAPAP